MHRVVRDRAARVRREHAWPSVVTALAVVCVLIGLMTLSSPAGFVLILETLHPQVWTTSPGVIYAFCVTIFGGFAQWIVSALWHASGSFYMPAWYVPGCGLASLVGPAMLKEAAHA
ncbi:hypothetical protein AQ611_20815 [Burkholderia singularis]|nr:hypothetical protein AQ611_20815 [Burkholderia sp. Bp7605]